MANSNFLLRSISDHSATITMLTKAEIKPRPPFKFLNLWAEKEDFLPMVHATWMEEADGPILQLTTKLRRIKKKLKEFHLLHSSHITRRVEEARKEWGKCQIDLDANPTNAGLGMQERKLAHQYNQLLSDEESYFRQKSRIQWYHHHSAPPARQNGSRLFSKPPKQAPQQQQAKSTPLSS
ncbi:hypothetical protein OIU84_002898 [Salix udensis]|uniref:Uncharacterized protein n=1 Tax=Salix udensis TaxID=889485 RepID=A0AAD6K5N3_9ROSI|nr:hypothetical protein OIU84_002898 [Salix udensis]